MVDLIVTNFNKNFTGVSATAANVIRQQMHDFDLRLVGQPLPGCPAPISLKEARAISRSHTSEKALIWHVRRNTEMRAAIWTRDVLRLPIKIVFTSAAIRLHSAFPRWLISKMDAVVATTERAADFVPHVRAVVPHGVDTEVFHPSSDRSADWAQLGHGGQIGIATIGRIRPEKGTDVFVEAMLQLLPKLPEARALIIGRAAREHQPFLKALKDKIAAAGLTERFVFTGEIPAAELPKVMRALHLVMQLPRYEGYGMTPLEGLASGVPFVGSEAGYYRAFASQGRAGNVVPLEDASAAAQAGLEILSQRQKWPQMAQDAREIAKHSFSSRSEADGVNAVYREFW